MVQMKTMFYPSLAKYACAGLLFVGVSANAQSLTDTAQNAGALANMFRTKPQDTTYIRQYAKDKPQVVLIYSGRDTQKLAEGIADVVRNHEAFKWNADHVLLCSLKDAESMEMKNDKHHLFLLCGEELAGEIPENLKAKIPDWSRADAKTALIKSNLMHDTGGSGLAFDTLVYAPDRANLTGMAASLLTRVYTSWKNMPRNEARKVNHLILFSDPESKETLEHWGQHERETRKLNGMTASKSGPTAAVFQPDNAPLLEFVEWQPLAAQKTFPALRTKGATQVFFISRALAKPELPENVRDLAYGKKEGTDKYGPLTTLVSKGVLADGSEIVVFSAQQKQTLEGLAVVHPNVESVEENALPKEAIDLREVRDAGLEILSNAVEPAMTAAIRERAIASIRKSLNITIAEDAALRQYKLVAQITQYEGQTVFNSSKRRVTPEPPDFTQAEPKRSTFGKGQEGAEAFNEAHREWSNRLENYRAHYQTDQCKWHLQLDRQESVKVSIHLKLIDANKPGEAPIWEKQVSDTYLAPPELFKEENPEVRGYGTVVQEIPPDPKQETCSDRTGKDGILKMLADTVGYLKGDAILPDGEAIDHFSHETPQQPYIKRITNNQITIDLQNLKDKDRAILKHDEDNKPLLSILAKIYQRDQVGTDIRKVLLVKVPLTKIYDGTADCVIDDKDLLEKLKFMMARQDYPLVDFAAAENTGRGKSVKAGGKTPAKKKKGVKALK